MLRRYVAQSSHLRVVWVGQGTGAGGRVFIEPFIDQLSRHPKLSDIVEFVTISRGSWATHEWSLDSVYTLICNCDIAIIPLPEDSWVNAKSSNRLTMLMALGMPTIVSPIPSYLRIINPGENSLLACTPDEYAEAINSYCDAGKRERIGKAGRETAIKQFSPETLGAEWIKVLEMVCKTPQTKPSSNMLTKFMSNLLQVSLFI